jgi:hypothetical protein
MEALRNADDVLRGNVQQACIAAAAVAWLLMMHECIIYGCASCSI